MSVQLPPPDSRISDSRPAITRLPTAKLSRRTFLIGSGVTAASLALYAGEVARHEIDVIDRPISIHNLPDAFRGFRIAQISDIHLDEYTEPWFLHRVIQRVNELAPDLVLVTGDFVTVGALTRLSGTHAIHRCAELLAGLTCPLRYAVLGNHDIGFGASGIIDALERNHLPVLVNRHIPIERNGSRLWICGTD